MTVLLTETSNKQALALPLSQFLKYYSYSSCYYTRNCVLYIQLVFSYVTTRVIQTKISEKGKNYEKTR